jgi:hypothetical protein
MASSCVRVVARRQAASTDASGTRTSGSVKSAMPGSFRMDAASIPCFSTQPMRYGRTHAWTDGPGVVARSGSMAPSRVTGGSYRTWREMSIQWPAPSCDRRGNPRGIDPIGPDRRPRTTITPNGKQLIVVHTSEGRLYRIDTATDSVVPIDLGTGDVCSADGLLLDGRTLYVVQNALNRIAVVELAPDHPSGTITRDITEPFASNPAIKVPTTIAEFGDALYAVTAGFAPPAPDFVVRLPK